MFYRFLLKAIKMDNWFLIWLVTIFLIFSTIAIVYVEPETFPTLFDGFWWVMTTVTTVGYGDYYPITTAGRIVGLFLYILGIGLIGVLIGKIVDWFAAIRKRREEGLIVYRGTGHVVIIGWSQKAHFAIEEILQSDQNMDIIMIDQLEKTPVLNERVHFIAGDASKKEILEKANVKYAKAVILFADDDIHNPLLTDGKSLIIASSIESIAPEVHTTVEIMDEGHIKNFKHIRIDEFVLTHDTISSLAVRSVFANGISTVYSQLISRKYGDDIYQIKKKKDWVTYRDAFHDLLKDGATLISDRENLNINRRLEETIPDNALLYIISDKETYEKIRVQG
jgi:voltage-gated potassium channel